MYNRFLALSLAGTLTAGCATGGYQSPDYRLPEGTTVELLETLQLPPNAARVFIQGGVAMRGNDVSLWDPHCSFGLNRTRDGQPLAREIGPARFVTGDVRIGVDAAMNGDDPSGDGDLLAERGIRVAGLFGGAQGGGTPWPYTYYTEIELFSEDEPQVDDLTCSFDGGPVNRNLTVEQIQSSLGDLARIY